MNNPHDLITRKMRPTYREMKAEAHRRAQEGPTMLRQLKQFVEDQADTETMIALAVFAKGLRQEYEARNIEAPEWLDDRIRQIGRALEASTRDAKELRLKEIAAERTRLLTPSEKRTALEAEEAKLRGELAQK